MKKILVIIEIIIIACVGCKKEEKYDDITYYDVIGEGYIFAYDSLNKKYPVKAEIHVATGLKGGAGLFSVNAPSMGIYTTDTTGKYQIRFIKRTHLSDANGYKIYTVYNGFYKEFEVSIEDIINVKNNKFILDTVKYKLKI